MRHLWVCINIFLSILAESWKICLYTVQTEWIPHNQPRNWRKMKKMADIYIQHIQLLECMVGACARLVSDSVI